MNTASTPSQPSVVLSDEDVSIEDGRLDAQNAATTERLSDDSWQANGQNKQNFQKN